MGQRRRNDIVALEVLGQTGAIGLTDSVLTGRDAWTGNSSGFVTTLGNLPPASYGQNAQLRWRTAYDTGTNPSGGGLRVDTCSIYPTTRVCCGGAGDLIFKDGFE